MSTDSPPSNEPGAAGVPSGLDYEVVRRIGRGGYGEVWLVRDRAGVYRACKVVYRESFNLDRPYEREYAGIQKFEPVSRENESQLHILHVGRRDEEGYFYYILELADDANTGREIHPGRYVPRTLRSDLQARGRLPLNECVHIGLALSAALEHLHRQGLIHRDIKPANIIFVNGIPKLADIGLVTDLEVSISYVGTEGYIPPEGPTSAQADIYSLGKVLYEISTGKDRLDFPELPSDIGEAPDRQGRLDFNAIVTRACQSDPRKRYTSAQDLHAELALLQTGGSVRRHRAAKRRWFWAAQAALALVILAAVFVAAGYFHKPPETSSPGQLEVAKLRVPDAAELVQSTREIEQEYRSKVTGATPESLAQLAGELVQQSATVANPAHEFATLQLAATLAKKTERYDLALVACDKIAARFQTNILIEKLALLSTGTLPARTARAGANLTEACVATAIAALAADDYVRAQALAAVAAAGVTNANQPHLDYELRFLDDELARCAAAYRQVEPSLQRLRSKPGDPAANLAVGEFLCFVKNDWETGLPLMARGNDEGLKPVLELELNQKPTRARDQIAAGDLWWDQATVAAGAQRLNALRRACFWYRKGIARTRGPEKEELKQRLADRLKAVPSPAARLRIVARVDTVEHISISATGVRWTSARGSFGNHLNWLVFGGLERGGVQQFPNAGATRLLPEDVDFSTARLLINHMAKRRARANLEVAEDHVRVTLIDVPGGMSDFDVTVVFGD